MTCSCKLCEKKVSYKNSDCNSMWEETLRSFFVVKSSIVCDTCVDEIYNKCFAQIKKGRKYIRYESEKKSPFYCVGSTFNREEKCS